MKDISWAKLTAKAIFYASIQASIGSVEMSSKFSVMNFSKDQNTLQRAADALRSYVIIGMVWTVGTILALYGSYGIAGAYMGLFMNAIMMSWMVVSYIQAFKEAAKNYNLIEPTILEKRDIKIFLYSLLVIALAILLFNKKMAKYMKV